MSDVVDSNRLLAEYEQYEKEGRIWGEVPIERIRKLTYPRVPEEIRNAYLALTDLTTSVADSLDAHGIHGAIAQTNLPNLIPGKRIAGTAVTLRNVPERKTPTRAGLDKDPIKMSSRECHYIAEPGDVLCVDFGGNGEASNMGGQSCLVAKTQGLAGAIVDGAVRDVNTIRALEFPIWCRGGTPKTGKYRMEAIEVNGPVTIHDVRVDPGDFVVADDSGVCVIPPELIEPILAECRKNEASEARSRELIRRKEPLNVLKPLFRARYNET